MCLKRLKNDIKLFLNYKINLKISLKTSLSLRTSLKEKFLFDINKNY